MILKAISNNEKNPKNGVSTRKKVYFQLGKFQIGLIERIETVLKYLKYSPRWS